METSETPRVHAFGEFELDEGLYELRREGRALPVEPRVFDVLRHLVRHRNRVVTKDELLERVWAGEHVTESVIHRAVNRARRLLGREGRAAIQTVHGRGYRFVAPVSTATAAPRAAGARPGPSDEIFVGREAVLEELRADLDEALAGRTRVFVLSGEPGIGKTRTAEELLRAARARGAGTAVGRCHEGGGAPALWPWIQILRALVEGAGGREAAGALGARAARIARLDPELARALGPAPALPELAVEEERFRLLDGVRHLLGVLAARTPLVVVLEDLHWADRATLQLLAFLARELREVPLLLGVTLRETERRRGEPLSAAVAELARHPGSRWRRLEGLSEPSVARLVAAAAGREPPPALVRALLERTEGNAFFLREALRLLAARGQLELAELVAEWHLDLPPGAHEVIAHRLEPLAEPCRRALDAAAVIGRDFSLALLERVAALAPHDLMAAVDEALGARIVQERDGQPGRFAFAHALVRETLLRELPRGERARLHARVGEALEALHAGALEPRLAELAHHFSEAVPLGDADKAIRYAERAAARATTLHADEEAALHYRRAVRLLERRERPDPERRLALLLALGGAHRRAGDTDQGREAFLAAAEVARALDRTRDFAHAAIGAYGLGEFGPRPNDAVRALLEEALERLGGGADPLRARVLAALSQTWPYCESWDEQRRLSAEALETARATGDPAALADAVMARREALNLGSEVEERIRLGREFLELSRHLPPTRIATEVFDQELQDLLMLGDAEELARRRAWLAQLADEVRHPMFRWQKAKDDANHALLEGRFDEAEARIAETWRIGRRMQNPWTLPVFFGQSFFLLLERGRIEDLERGLEAARESYAWVEGLLPALATVVATEAGDRELARRRLEALFPAEPEGPPSLGGGILVEAAVSWACAELGDAPRAARLEEALRPHRRLQVVLRGINVYLSPATRYLALLAATRGRRREAAELFADALAAAERLGARPAAAHIRHEWGRLLLDGSASERRRGAALLEEARAAAAALGMAGLERRLARTTCATP